MIVLRYAIGSQSTLEREQGCLDALAAEFPGIEVISSDQYSGETADKALVKSQQLLLSFGDRLDGVFTPTQQVSTGMLRAASRTAAGRKSKVRRLRSRPRAGRALRSGKMHGIVLQDPADGPTGRHHLGRSSRRQTSRAPHRHRRSVGHPEKTPTIPISNACSNLRLAPD